MPSFKRQGSNLYPELWTKLLSRFKGAPAAACEIGSWEGQSALWFLDNILTHPQAKLTCIDTFEGNPQHKDRGYDCGYLLRAFQDNLAEPLASGKARVLVGYSQRHLREMWSDAFDFGYVDGAHDQASVLEDMVLLWRLIKPGGIMICDDYAYKWKDQEPKLAIDAFIQCFAAQLTVLHKGAQAAIMKNEVAA